MGKNKGGGGGNKSANGLTANAVVDPASVVEKPFSETCAHAAMTAVGMFAGTVVMAAVSLGMQKLFDSLVPVPKNTGANDKMAEMGKRIGELSRQNKELQQQLDAANSDDEDEDDNDGDSDDNQSDDDS